MLGMMVKIIKFDMKEIITDPKKFYKRNFSRSIKKNCEDYMKWIMNTLEYYHPVIKAGNNYDSCAISMNAININYFYKHLDAMFWLNYSPIKNESLADDEFSIDLDKIEIENQ